MCTEITKNSKDVHLQYKIKMIEQLWDIQVYNIFNVIFKDFLLNIFKFKKGLWHVCSEDREAVLVTWCWLSSFECDGNF